MDRIKVRYSSRHHQGIIPWLDEAIKKTAKENGYEFIGSGYAFMQKEMNKITKKNYRSRKWFSLDSIANFIAEYSVDGLKDVKDVWTFLWWLDRKSKPK